LLPDPCDEDCPNDFKVKARKLLPFKVGTDDMALRKALLKFIGDFANWDMASNATFLEAGRSLVRAAHPEETPLVVDPFAGGGSIPLEALRLGCEAYASDLNPVACLILKILLDDVPKYGPRLAEDLRKTGAEVRAEASRDLAEFYPRDPNGDIPVAYLWARTVRCEASDCGAEVPLIRSFWLSKKPNRKLAMRARIARPRRGPPGVEFEIFEPEKESDVAPGTVTRAKARCPCCNQVLLPARVRSQLSVLHGGADVIFDAKGNRMGGARLLAVVTLKPGTQGRHYRLPTADDYSAVRKASEAERKLAKSKLPSGLRVIPDEPLPPIGTLGFRVQRYGVLRWGELFTARQRLSLATICKASSEIGGSSLGRTDSSRALLALALGKTAERNNTICDWMVDVECPGHLFSQQVMPPSWDFAEAAIFGDASGSYGLVVENTADNLQSSCTRVTTRATVRIGDARAIPLPDQSASCFFTDPPYYNAVPYSDLSDFFFVWIKRVLGDHPFARDPFDTHNPLTPKSQEIVQDETRHYEGLPKDARFFENSMASAFAEGSRTIARDPGIGCIVFAHKTTEGWEALLTGLSRAGWLVTASWPILTERSSRTRARDSAALGACRRTQIL